MAAILSKPQCVNPFCPSQTYSVVHIDGLVQDCTNSIANALELLQSCTKPSTWYVNSTVVHCFVVVILPFIGHTCHSLTHIDILKGSAEILVYKISMGSHCFCCSITTAQLFSLFGIIPCYNIYQSLIGKLWYLQHHCVGDTIVYH